MENSNQPINEYFEFICHDSECECKSRSECKGLWTSKQFNHVKKSTCKDCIEPIEDCTCIEDTIEFPKQEPKKVLTEEDIFNQKDIDVVTDYINKEQQKQHLIDMMESDEELELYDDSREIKFEDVFNEDKKEAIKKFIDEIGAGTVTE